MGIYTLCKAERLNSKILIGKMFEGGVSKSFSIFPIRVVYMPVEQGEAPASILILSLIHILVYVTNSYEELSRLLEYEL